MHKLLQGSYASGKCQGNLIFFKVRELSGNFMLSGKNEILLKCQGNVREIYNFQFVSNYDYLQKMTTAVF